MDAADTVGDMEKTAGNVRALNFPEEEIRCRARIYYERHWPAGDAAGASAFPAELSGLLGVFPPIFCGEDAVAADGTLIHAGPLFKKLGKRVKRVFLYLVTAGESAEKKTSAFNKLAADLWGVSLVDGGRELVREDICAEVEREFPGCLGNDLFLSPMLCPGFFGMEILETKRIHEALGGDAIGVRMLESGAMLPPNSVSGMVFLVEGPANWPELPCKSCLGNARGCVHCMWNGAKGED